MNAFSDVRPVQRPGRRAPGPRVTPQHSQSQKPPRLQNRRQGVQRLRRPARTGRAARDHAGARHRLAHVARPSPGKEGGPTPPAPGLRRRAARAASGDRFRSHRGAGAVNRLGQARRYRRQARSDDRRRRDRKRLHSSNSRLAAFRSRPSSFASRSGRRRRLLLPRWVRVAKRTRKINPPLPCSSCFRAPG